MRKKKNTDPEVKEEVLSEQQQEASCEETIVWTPEQMAEAKEKVEALNKEIDTLKKEKEETIALLQRNQADFENYRRRNASLRTDSLAEGKRDCMTALLPVIDNFDRAFSTEADPESWKEGIGLVYKQLLEILGKLDLKEIPADGKFDPNFHYAVMQEKVEGKESGEILEVFQKGYAVSDKIIRHTMVKVAE